MSKIYFDFEFDGDRKTVAIDLSFELLAALESLPAMRKALIENLPSGVVIPDMEIIVWASSDAGDVEIVYDITTGKCNLRAGRWACREYRKVHPLDLAAEIESIIAEYVPVK
jgi:hypothetical protein